MLLNMVAIDTMFVPKKLKKKKENREKTLTPTSKPSTSPYTYSTEEKEDDGERSRKEEDPRVNGNIFGLIFTNQSRWVVEQMGILIETRVL